MPDVVCEPIVSLDIKARGGKLPGYCGHMHPELDAWFKKTGKQPHRTF